MRRARALPYELHVHALTQPHAGRLTLNFRNTGAAGAVFHVYDRLHLDRIPRRYTVEATKALSDDWALTGDQGRYDLWVLGPNGFLREFRGTLRYDASTRPELEMQYDVANLSLHLILNSEGHGAADLVVRSSTYRPDGLWRFRVAAGHHIRHKWSLVASHQWYDFSVIGEDFERRFAGRLESGAPSFSDPAV